MFRIIGTDFLKRCRPPVEPARPEAPRIGDIGHQVRPELVGKRGTRREGVPALFQRIAGRTRQQRLARINADRGLGKLLLLPRITGAQFQREAVGQFIIAVREQREIVGALPVAEIDVEVQ